MAGDRCILKFLWRSVDATSDTKVISKRVNLL